MTDSDVTFGDWLRRQRRALDLTRAELAARVGCSVSALRKFEADELRPSRPLAESLAGALQIAPEGRAAFVRFARDTPGADTTCLPVATVSLQHPAPRSTVRSTMPAPATTLIGREQERAALGQLVCRSHTRLLTLTGPGGSGKTRLALQVATDVQAAFADGAVFVDLAPIRDPALVTATIARPFGLLDVGAQPLMQRLQTALRDTHLLLVLDNFEHVLVAAPVVAGLLAAAPRLTILLTSRVVVGVYGEHTFLVPPLRLPDLHALPPVDQLLQVETVRLFVVRAQATRLDFRLTHANARAVSEICHRLDGLPLSIELAAMRVHLLPPQALLDGLNSRLSMLTGGPRTLPARQQTLRDTLAWSYDLLDAHAQGLFRRLAVFVGGCTLAAVERVCDVDGDLGLDALKGLASLLDNSLLQQWEGSDGEPRFSMLETIREYALERLATSGMAETIQGAHADYYLALAEAAEIQVRDGAEKLWLHRLEVEYPNLRAALVRSQTEADGIAELRLVLALNWFWLRSGYLSEARLWLADALTPRAGAASRPDTAASRALRAKALAQLGTVAAWQNDQAAAQPALEESLALFRELGDTWSIADTLATLGIVVLFRGESERSGALLEESLTLFRQLEDARGIADCFFFMGHLAYAQGNLRQAGERWQEALGLFRQLDNTWMIANSLLHLGIGALDQGDDERAGACLAESLTRFRDLGERWATVHTLEVCAGLAAAQAHQRADAEGAGRRAARLFGAAEALREKLGAPLLPIYHDHYQRGVAATRAHLDEATFAAAWAEGRAMMLEQAIAEALDAINDRPITRATEDVNAAVR